MKIMKIWPFSRRRERDEALLCALEEIRMAIIRAPYNAFVNAPESLDYHRELRQLADASKDVQGAAELLARWLALQLPPEARKDVQLPDDWKNLS